MKLSKSKEPDKPNELKKPNKPKKPKVDLSQGKDPGQYFIFGLNEINKVRSPPP